MVLGANEYLSHGLIRALNIEYGAKNVVAADKEVIEEIRFGSKLQLGSISQPEQL